MLGLIIRLALLPFTYDYDMYHWGIIIQNINSGNGLYELNGYFYTPIWGYIMGFVDLIMNNLASVMPIGERVTSLLPVEDLDMRHVATITSIEFIVAMKLPLILCDIAVGYLIYDYIKGATQDVRKAECAFALWFLCPINIYMSGVQGMFDNFSALFLLLSVILAVKNHYFLSGAVFVTAVLTKIFPVACIFVYLGLIIARHPGKKKFISNFTIALTGMLVSALIWFLPNILAGNIADTLTVATDRASNSSMNILDIATYAAIFACGILMMYFGLKMSKYRENPEGGFLDCCTYCMCAMMFVSVSPQYVIAALPLIIIWIVRHGFIGKLYWALIGTGSMISAFALNNYSLLMGASHFWNIPAAQTVINGLVWADNNLLIGTIVTIGYAMMLFGLACIILYFFKKKLGEHSPKFVHYLDVLENVGKGDDCDA